MRTPCSIAALLWVFASLTVLAVVPPASSQSVRAKGIDAREAISWLNAQRTEDVRPKFEARLATSHSSTDHPLASIDAPPAAATTIKPPRDEEAAPERPVFEDKRQTSLNVQGDAESTGLVPAEAQQDRIDNHPTLVVRSAAPKVFGVNIYLILAWLVLMYLMFRTGSY